MERFLSRVAVSLTTALAALIFVAAAVGFLGVAIYLAFEPVVPAAVAALIVGVIGFILAGSLVLVARYSLRHSISGSGVAATPALGADDIGSMAARLGGIAACELNHRAQAHPYYAFAIALLAGLATG